MWYGVEHAELKAMAVIHVLYWTDHLRSFSDTFMSLLVKQLDGKRQHSSDSPLGVGDGGAVEPNIAPTTSIWHMLKWCNSFLKKID